MRTPSFEYLEFDNRRGIRHICWLISQTTAIATSHIQVYSAQHNRLGYQVNCSKTLADLCDIFSSAQNTQIYVCAEPPRGIRRDLGILTVERVGTLRPQLQPPYLTGTVRPIESFTDYDHTGLYYDHMFPRSPSLISAIFEISLHLPFMQNVITTDILGSSSISDIMTWSANILSQYHMTDLAPQDDQLHFTNGYAINPDTIIGNVKIDYDQRFYIISRKSTAHSFHGAYTRIMHGYYHIQRKFIVTEQRVPLPVFTDNDNRDTSGSQNSEQTTSSVTSNTDTVDMSTTFMLVESRAGSVRTNSASTWPMGDSGCELTVFPSLDLFVEQIPHRTEIITAKADCRIISTIRGTVRLPVLDRMGNKVTLTISPVLYAPECDMPLLSIDALNKQGFHVVFAPTYAGIFQDSLTMIPFQKVRNMWFLPIIDSPPPFTYALKVLRPDLSVQVLWHLTLGHASHRVVYETSQISKNIPKLPIPSDNHFCPICAQSKMRARNTPPPTEHRTTVPGDLIHYDMSFLDTPTLHGCKIVSNFIDDRTSYKWRFIHRTRDALTLRTIFRKFHAIVKSIRLKPTNEPMRSARLRSDNGAEITGQVMDEWTTDTFVVPETTATHTPSQNGKAEVTGGNSSTVA